MRKIVLTYGLIAGVMLSVMMFASIVLLKDVIPFDKGMYVGYTSMVLAFLMIYFGVRTYRDTVGGGAVTFGRAFKVGILITAVAATCYVATWLVVYNNFIPDYMDRYTVMAVEHARKDGATEAQVAEKVAEMAKYKKMYENPLMVVALTYLEPLPVGVVFTLVTAGVLSRKRRPDGMAPA